MRSSSSLGMWWGVAQTAAVDWWKGDSLQVAASLAFYTVFSLTPLVLLMLTLLAWVFGEEEAASELIAQAERLVGEAGAEVIGTVVENAERSDARTLAGWIGFGTVALGVSAVFAQLQRALNRIWGVKLESKRSALFTVVRIRALAFAVAVGGGFLMMVSLAVSTALSATRASIARKIPDLDNLLFVAEEVVSFLVISTMFMAVFKVMPDARNRWSDVFVGGAITAFLFLLGKEAIGFYLGHATIGNAYGAAGSFIVLLVWLYYSAAVFLLGAHITHVYTSRHGSGVQPEQHAEMAEVEA